MLDLLIVGGGPAGISCALTARRRNLQTMVVFNGDGALGKAHLIDNYPGLANIAGQDLLAAFRAQAEQAGVEMKRAMVQKVLPMEDSFSVMADNEVLEARAVVLCCGTARVKTLAGEEDLLGMGVSYCATCDGMFYRGKTMLVIGAGAEAVEEANYLSELGTVQYVKERAHDTGKLHPGIAVLQGRPQSIARVDSKMQVTTDAGTYEADGVFVFRPAVAMTQLLPEVETENGVVKIDQDCKTNVPGVFACGDMTGGMLQITKATGEGTVAALAADQFIKQRKQAQ